MGIWKLFIENEHYRKILIKLKNLEKIFWKLTKNVQKFYKFYKMLNTLYVIFDILDKYWLNLSENLKIFNKKYVEVLKTVQDFWEI